MSNQDLSLLAMGVDPEELAAGDPFVGRQLIEGGSFVTTHAGEIIERLVTDEAVWLTMVMDFSHSTDSPGIRNAFRTGYQIMMQDKLAKSAVRKKLQVQRIHFGSSVNEEHSFEPLVIMDPATKSTGLNIPLLPQNFTYLGSTATIDALEKALADQRAMERVSAADIEDIVAEHIVILFTDGRLNQSIALAKAMRKGGTWNEPERTEFLSTQVRDVRNFIKLRNERWSFMTFCTVEPQVASLFMEEMQQSRMGAEFTAFIQQRLDDRLAVIAKMSPENRPNVTPTLETEAAQLMYEAMMAGWGYFVDDENEIDNIPDADTRLLAQLYRQSERVIIESIEYSYFALGGLGMKPQNVLTVLHNPDAVLELVGTHMSSSVIRQTGGSQTAIAVNLTPAQADDEDDAAVF